eukprot:204969_1
MSAPSKPIVVVGAGLTGCCITLLLTKVFKNQKIILIETRDDYRKELQRIHEASKQSKLVYGNFDNAATRSINLALSHRGICTLKECGIYDDIVQKDLLLLMKGRYVHLDPNKVSKQLYGQDHEGIHSISRLTLNCLFLDKLASYKNVDIRFNCKVTKVLQNGRVLCADDTYIDSEFVLGCDGAYSTVRASLQRFGRYNFNMQYVDHGYKELTVFPNKDGGFKMDEHYLHIWPKHEFMLISLPNPDKTFTCTLFAPWNVLETLSEAQSIERFFQEHFPDFIDVCPNYVNQCLTNPSSPLAHIHLSKWNCKDKILLLGDAAHAIVPFYGQGMNAGFEDCLILYNLMKDKYHEKFGIEALFDMFSKTRQPATEALSHLSLQNYVEMRSLTAKQWFVYKKKLEKTLNYYAPELWKPIYSMVSFSRIPYDEALVRAKKQDKYLSMALTGGFVAGAATMVAAAFKYDAFGVVKSKSIPFIQNM